MPAYMRQRQTSPLTPLRRKRHIACIKTPFKSLASGLYLYNIFLKPMPLLHLYNVQTPQGNLTNQHFPTQVYEPAFSNDFLLTNNHCL